MTTKAKSFYARLRHVHGSVLACSICGHSTEDRIDGIAVCVLCALRKDGAR